MKRPLAGAVLASLILLAGCTPPLVEDPPVPSMRLLDEVTGWVSVEVTGATATGYRIVWGDEVDQPTAVLPWRTDYEYFYHVPGTYTIKVAADAAIADRLDVTIAFVDCRVSFVRTSGRTLTCRYWGRYGIEYAISWGDGTGEHVIAMTGTGVLTHTYDAPGAYLISMGEIWAPPRPQITAIVE